MTGTEKARCRGIAAGCRSHEYCGGWRSLPAGVTHRKSENIPILIVSIRSVAAHCRADFDSDFVGGVMALTAFVPVRTTALVEKIQELAWSMHRNCHHMMLIMMLWNAGAAGMRTTLNIDDDLLREAQRMTGVTEKTALVREGLRALIERESARRLARLGGSDSQLQPISRRKS